MKRSDFLMLAGTLACLFGVGMVAAPSQMMAGMTNGSSAEGALVLRWMGSALIAVGLMNFIARNDPGSVALRAIFIGNIALHVIGMLFDVLDWQAGFVRTTGVVSGSVVHLGLILGFMIFLRGAGPKPAEVGATSAAAVA